MQKPARSKGAFTSVAPSQVSITFPSNVVAPLLREGFCILQINVRRVQFRRYEYRTPITN